MSNRYILLRYQFARNLYGFAARTAIRALSALHVYRLVYVQKVEK